MSQVEIRDTEKAMFYLIGCALNGKQPDREAVKAVDQKALYDLSQQYSLSSLTASALEKTELSPEDKSRWQNVRFGAIRREMLFDAERTEILNFLEENGIWYMPLKGTILKSLYPQMGTREMTDNDILIDAARSQEVRLFLEARGYESVVGKGADDDYRKPPVFHFEMHRMLIHRKDSALWAKYYESIYDRLLPEPGTTWGRRFRDEDFYVFLILHAFKHFKESGIGPRCLVDFYVYLREKKGTMDMEYVSRECEKLGVREFEEKCRNLCEVLFSPCWDGKLSEAQSIFLNRFWGGSTFGSTEQKISSWASAYQDENGKVHMCAYIMRRLFPSLAFMETYCPVLVKWPVLLPFTWIYRLVHQLLTNGKGFLGELHQVRKS